MLTFYLQMLETGEDQSEFEKIYYTYREMMTGIAMQMLHNQHDAEDAVHQAFLAMIVNFPKLHKMKRSDLTAYIVVIVKNKSTDILRERKRIIDAEYDDNIRGNDFPTPDIIGLPNALARIPERYRTVLLLRFHYGYKTRELAKIYNLPQASVQKLIWRAKQALQKELDGEKELCGK